MFVQTLAHAADGPEILQLGLAMLALLVLREGLAFARAGLDKVAGRHKDKEGSSGARPIAEWREDMRDINREAITDLVLPLMTRSVENQEQLTEVMRKLEASVGKLALIEELRQRRGLED
jgi:hypothetical protein